MQFLVSLTVCHHRLSSWQRQSFSLQVLGWVFNLLGCQLLPHFVVVVGVWFWLRILGLMLVSKILGPVWYNHRQTFFPHVKITCRKSSRQILAVPRGWASLSTLKPLSLCDSSASPQPCWFHSPPAAAASLSPSPRLCPAGCESAQHM